MKSNLLRLAILSAIVSMGGCAKIPPHPEPLTKPDVRINNDVDAAANPAKAQPISGPLTLEQAMARALKFNLERRTKLMEEALALKILDVSKFDMLPKLLVDAGYLSRDSDMIRRSTNAQTGALSPSQFISEERDHGIADLGVSWSLLDLGIGYFNAQQQANRVLVAVEKRRRAMHVLMQDVRVAYWRAASAQKLQGEVQDTIKQAEAALEKSRTEESARVRNPMQALRYQRQLLENLRLLEAIHQELSVAQTELAALINAPQGEKFEVADVEPGKIDLYPLEAPVSVLEEMALEDNPELLEQHYGVNIARIETHKTIARMFPNLSLGANLKYDSDNYLVDSTWREASVQLSYNLVNLLSAPAQYKLAEAGVELAKQRRMAMQMAVLAQVHLARQQFGNAAAQFTRADQIWQTDQRIADQSAKRVAAKVDSSLEKVSTRTASLLSQLRRYQALAQAQAAEARLQATLGVEPRLDNVPDDSVDSLAKQMQVSMTLSSAVASRALGSGAPGPQPVETISPEPTPATDLAPATEVAPAPEAATPTEAAPANESAPVEAAPAAESTPVEASPASEPTSEAAPEISAEPAAAVDAPLDESIASVENPSPASQSSPADMPSPASAAEQAAAEPDSLHLR